MNHDFFLYLGIGAVVVAVLSFIILSKIIKLILRVVAILLLIGIVHQCSTNLKQKNGHDQQKDKAGAVSRYPFSGQRLA